jgi:glycosyltransferase involved in cell wall biosynthesis
MGRSLVLFTGSDLDVSETYRPDSKAINDCGSRADRCYEALAHAHTIVVQTRTQAKLLAERFGRQGVVISNPIDFMEGVAGTGARTRRFILWVGKSDAIKRPESAIELARMCPNVPFTMVMNRADPAVFAQIHAACPPNLEMIERVAPRQMASLYEGAVALLNTSRVEGFPNAFLEAGKHGAPVVSLTVDPDGIIARHDAGMVAGGDLNRLAEAVRKFHADPDTARRCGANLRAYVRRHHSLSDSLARLDALFRRLTVERTVPPCAALPAS